MIPPYLLQELAQLTGEHCVLVLSSMAIAIGAGLPLGILLTRRPSLRTPLLGFANVM
jgi:osmoprotectant transport system permease protein